MDPPVRRGFGHAVQEEALRQLADEGTRGRGAEVLFRRARDGEVVSGARRGSDGRRRSEEHTSELQSLAYLVCRLLLEKKKPAQVPTSPEPSSANPNKDQAPVTTPAYVT